MTVTTRRPSLTRRLTTALFAVTSLLTTACATERAVSGPSLPGNSPVSQFKPAAFIADVNLRTGKVVITDPTVGTSGRPTLSIGGEERPNLSLLGGEAVRLVPSNYTASAPGAFAPNKIRVTFDIEIDNKLPGVKFITPTWPVPPSAGVILFPLDFTVTTTPGGTTGGDGNVIIVEQPSFGGIEPSIDWNGTRSAGSGAPFNFFNDVVCTAGASSDCFRWEAFDLEIQPGGRSTRHTVGFDIDVTVAQFRTRMIVAADLAPAVAVAPGSISGVVTSAVRGNLSGVVVTVAPGGQTGTSAATTGAYSIAAVDVGSRTLTVSNLPAGCTAPAAQTVIVNTAANTVANFSVTCTGLPGTLTGTISSNVPATVLTGITVTASNSGSPLSGNALVTGAYSIANVAAGSGTLALTNLPTGCTAPASTPYAMTSGGPVNVNIAITCPVPTAPGYQYNTTWTNIAGGFVQLDVRIDMRTFNRPDIDDVTTSGVTGDPITLAELAILFDQTRLIYNAAETANATIPNPRLSGSATIGANTPGRLNVLNFATGAGVTGNIAVVRLVFARNTGGTTGTQVGTTTTFTNIASRQAGVPVDIVANVVNLEAPYILPAPLP